MQMAGWTLYFVLKNNYCGFSSVYWGPRVTCPVTRLAKIRATTFQQHKKCRSRPPDIQQSHAIHLPTHQTAVGIHTIA